MNKYLIFRTDRIGDLLITCPLIATIKKHHKHINHYHTAGVPGRNEIDDTQELFYPAIMKAIVETGFQGFVAQEFIPTNPNEISSLKKVVIQKF